MAMAAGILAAAAATGLPGLASAAAEAADGDDADDDQPLSAQELLRDVRACFPREPLRVDGDLGVFPRRGKAVASVTFSMDMHWGVYPARFEYRLVDALGAETQRATITLAQGRPATFVVEMPDGTRDSGVDLNAAVGPTDITWADLSLSFLWWPGGTIVGTDEVKGRTCHVVDLPAPAWTGADAQASYHHLRLWIDERLRMLVKAEGRDREGRALRELRIRSLKKSGGFWVIKELEVQALPAVYRTRLRVRDVRSLDAE